MRSDPPALRLTSNKQSTPQSRRLSHFESWMSQCKSPLSRTLNEGAYVRPRGPWIFSFMRPFKWLCSCTIVKALLGVSRPLRYVTYSLVAVCLNSYMSLLGFPVCTSTEYHLPARSRVSVGSSSDDSSGTATGLAAGAVLGAGRRATAEDASRGRTRSKGTLRSLPPSLYRTLQPLLDTSVTVPRYQAPRPRQSASTLQPARSQAGASTLRVGLARRGFRGGSGGTTLSDDVARFSALCTTCAALSARRTSRPKMQFGSFACASAIAFLA
mmetsp:Transcript_8200/g.23085  ORF Transcript_8200/g.23085 Transcript_8200/m.23085 type:complete len:270 (-) Transcript_8200:1042-1851(-)